MSDNTLTVALEGDVALSEFVEAMRHFYNLITLLSREVAEGVDIQWMLEDLQHGSAITTAAGIAEEPEPVLKVIRAYGNLGRALERRDPIPFSQAVAREAMKITETIGSNVTAIRFETAESDSVIYGVFDSVKVSQPSRRISFGMVRGKVQAINSRGKLRFTLYDSIFDKPVSCYLKEGQEELMREIWGKEVFVAGVVTRDNDHGRATAIREITAIDPVPVIIPGSYKLTRGILSNNDEPAEVSIRRLRDGESD